MSFAGTHKLAAYMLAALGLTALCAGGELDGLLSIALVVAVVASWFAEGALLEAPWYVRAWNATVVGTLALEIARVAFFDLTPLSAAVEFASMLQLSRLANRRGARDYQQITVLAMLHLIAATVLGAGLSYALCFIGFVLIAPWAMVLGHLRREIEGNYLADARSGHTGLPIDVARILRSKRVVGAGLLAGSSLLSVPIFVITATTFVLFPRIGVGILQLRGKPQTVAGLGDQVDLTGHGTIRDDPTIVLTVKPPADQVAEHPASRRQFRLRGAAFDHYDGHVWTRGLTLGSRHLPQDDGVYRLRGVDFNPHTDLPFDVASDVLDPPIVLTIPGTIAIRAKPHVENGQPRYPDVRMTPAGELRLAQPPEEGTFEYTAMVRPGRGDDDTLQLRSVDPHEDTVFAGLPPDEIPGRFRLSAEDYERYTQVPDDLTPSVRTLARQWIGGNDTPRTMADAIVRQLYRYRYTLVQESGEAQHPLDDFLLRTRAGHCEYFSSAMAVMLRTAGVPTRNVTGFLGGTFNRYGGFYAVRSGDAHSWVEIRDPVRGWVTYDPTPPSREAATPVPHGPQSEVAAMLEALRVRWRQYIVGFDLRTQTGLWLRVFNWLRRPQSGHSNHNQRQPTDPHRRDPLVPANFREWVRRVPWKPLILAGAVAFVVVTVVRSRALRRRPAQRYVITAQGRAAMTLAKVIDGELATRGHARPRTRPVLAWVQELARTGDAFARTRAMPAAERYVAARFGGEAFAPGELERLKRELRARDDRP